MDTFSAFDVSKKQYCFKSETGDKILPVKSVDVMGLSKSKANEKLRKNITNPTGVYILLLKDDYSLDCTRFYSEVTGIFFKDGKIENPYTVQLTPKLNADVDDYNICHMKKHHVAYVGSAKKLYSSIIEHLFGSKINGTASLKLGFRSREALKQHLTLFVINCAASDRGKLESSIRKDFGSYFGK